MKNGNDFSPCNMWLCCDDKSNSIALLFVCVILYSLWIIGGTSWTSTFCLFCMIIGIFCQTKLYICRKFIKPVLPIELLWQALSSYPNALTICLDPSPIIAPPSIQVCATADTCLCLFELHLVDSRKKLKIVDCRSSCLFKFLVALMLWNRSGSMVLPKLFTWSTPDNYDLPASRDPESTATMLSVQYVLVECSLNL
ncbi:hypothetical protein VNO77_17638 [Canavalia gladiata]|uniref:Uncharacterized protein n=1 Tax=Canavalia gladiata TaxID=3824 RepID=A0AAN9LJF2_CANGL